MTGRTEMALVEDNIELDRDFLAKNRLEGRISLRHRLTGNITHVGPAMAFETMNG